MSEYDTPKIKLFGGSEIKISDVFDIGRGIYFVPMLDESTASAVNGINKLHQLGYTGKGQKGAILDSGVLPEHPFLKDRLEAMEDFTGHGPKDRIGHGTLVAVNYAMAAPDASILSGKVFENDDAPLSDHINRIAQGVNWAVDKGATGINISLGLEMRKEDLSKEPGCSQAVKNVCEAIERAIQSNISICVAAGANFPADCHELILVVGVSAPTKQSQKHKTSYAKDVPPIVTNFYEPYLVPTFVYEGYLSLRKGLYEQALDALNIAVERYPDYKVWYYRGRCFYGLKRYEEAIQSFDAAIALDPTDEAVWYSKGLALKAISQNDKAIECFDKILDYQTIIEAVNSLDAEANTIENSSCYPRNLDSASNAWNDMGFSYEQANRYDEAARCYDKAIKLNKKNAQAYSNLGGILGRRGEYEDAMKYFDKAIEIDPSNIDSWYNKGLALSRLNRYKESLEFLDKAIELDPSFFMASNEKNRVLNKLKFTKT